MRESLYDFCIREGRRELLEQWVADINLRLTPTIISRGSKRKVWWRCEKGHNWQAAVHTRTGSGTGCPVCANRKIHPTENDLAAQYPQLATQWHPTKNGSLTPEQIPPGTTRKVWWRCEKGHDYQAVIGARVMRANGCPYCAGRKVLPGFNDLATTHPKIAAQWHPLLNGSLTPQMVTAGSNKKVW